MSFFPDMGTQSLIASGEYVRAIGWLHPDYPYTKGVVPEAFLSRLKEFAKRCGQSTTALNFAVAGGIHTCEFCGNAHGTGNFGVPDDNLLFVAPEMVVHYVEKHAYCPPEEFVAAVLRSPLPDTDEYQLYTKPFWQQPPPFVEPVGPASSSAAAFADPEPGRVEAAGRECTRERM